MAKQVKKTIRVTSFPETAKIIVVKPYEARKGSNVARVWSLIEKSKTIAQYRAARKRAKYGDNVGGMLATFVNAGHVRITATK